MDIDGNIVVYLNKDKASSAQRAANILKRFKGKDVTLILYPFARKAGDQVQVVADALKGLGEEQHLDR